MAAIFKLTVQLCSNESEASPKINKATQQSLICLLLVSSRHYEYASLLEWQKVVSLLITDDNAGPAPGDL